jgi:HCOMODA/2-hydroxy-3-carboxy-muconic semialdehyde decarboxylase
MCPNHEGREHSVVASGAPGKAAAPADPVLIGELVTANRILSDHGVVDAFGHVSVRHDKAPTRFLLARNMAPALVTADDILEFDLDSNPIGAEGRAVYLERFIHAEIYRARPDVRAVVHSHAASVVPFGVVADAPLRPVWHMSGFLGAQAPVFEIRDIAGNSSDLLIRNGALGAALAQALGDDNVVLMRGHGATIVGPDLRQAVFRAVYTELNARIQSDAMRLGAVDFLTAQEAQAAAAANAGQVDRAWTFWARKAGG